ncbi:16884_t:CDS:2, partial [Cetraspora pellucida]
MTNNLTGLTRSFKIKKYDFTGFSNLEKVGSGAFGTLITFAKLDTHRHPNIIKFYETTN